MSEKKARVIAMYLPQYHPIPENDAVWGKGFTEWTNVGKAKPLFRGHYQPRVPADLGYYDLRMPEIREAQAVMARDAGVEGFMYWHYWFGNGRKALERPFEEVLFSGRPDFPFCLGWANHSWRSDQWNNALSDKKKSPFIFEQLYPGDKDAIAHFNYVLPAFKDNRYIRVDNQPLFLIWAPNEIPDLGHFIDLWNTMAQTNGIDKIHFVGLVSGTQAKIEESRERLKQQGISAIATSNVWIAESKVKSHVEKVILNILSKKFPKYAPLNKYKYSEITKHLCTELDSKEDVYPSIIPNWDRSPRSGRRAVIYTGSTPELFKNHIEQTLDLIANKQNEHKIVFLRTWNEWAEGNYVEPDLKYGHGYLNALRDTIISD